VPGSCPGPAGQDENRIIKSSNDRSASGLLLDFVFAFFSEVAGEWKKYGIELLKHTIQ
jgi:hypothetical protein